MNLFFFFDLLLLICILYAILSVRVLFFSFSLVIVEVHGLCKNFHTFLFFFFKLYQCFDSDFLF